MTDKTKRQSDLVIAAAVDKGVSLSFSYRSDARRWSHNLDRRLFYTGPGSWPTACVPSSFLFQSVPSRPNECYAIYPLSVPSFVYSDGGNGIRYEIRDDGAGFTAGLAGDFGLYIGVDGSVLIVRPDNSVDQFDAANGLLRRRAFASGGWQEFEYSTSVTPTSIAPIPDLLIAVRDTYGRSIQLTYGLDQQLSSAIDPAGRGFALAGGERLHTVTGPDGHSRRYLYDEPAQVSGYAGTGLLTGRLDEANARTATYAYDSMGNAVSTERAGGTERYELLPSDNYFINIMRTPNGGTTSFNLRKIEGSSAQVAHLVQYCRPGKPCPESYDSYAYDAMANVVSIDNRSGNRTCRTVDARNLETSFTEGLPPGSNCSAGVLGEARRTTTKWHPHWRLRAQVAEPGRVTTFVYNGQPDPLNGNAIATCAPSTALLPDGKPIAVLCHQVEQATTDVNGALGFSATVVSTVPARISKWTYNQHGQVLTEDGPRTDVIDVTTYAYYSTTTADYTMGDLQSVTNAAGKVTRYTKYNKHGQVLELIDPNGVVTTSTYDLRQRLLSTTVGGRTTSHEYWPTGLIKKTTSPNGSFISYEYDDAQRLKAVANNLGHRIEYTLDNAGNRTGEAVKDPTGVLRRQMSRSIDALGRVQQSVGRQ
jgi:YD repeat-containing protein